MRSSASPSRRSSSAGIRRSACASGSTTMCRPAPRSIRRSSWSTMRSPSPAGSTSPSAAGTPASTGSTIRTALDPSGQPYRPFHDVQMMVDGDAALALAELARERWARVHGERHPRVAPAGSPWPQSIGAGFPRRRNRHCAHAAAARTRRRNARSRSPVSRHDRARRAVDLYRKPVPHLRVVRRALGAAPARAARA